MSCAKPHRQHNSQSQNTRYTNSHRPRLTRTQNTKKTKRRVLTNALLRNRLHTHLLRRQLLLLHRNILLHKRERQHLLNRIIICQEHNQAINTHSPAPSRRQAIFQTLAEILVDHLRLVVALVLVRPRQQIEALVQRPCLRKQQQRWDANGIITCGERAYTAAAEGSKRVGVATLHHAHRGRCQHLYHKQHSTLTINRYPRATSHRYSKWPPRRADQ